MARLTKLLNALFGEPPVEATAAWSEEICKDCGKVTMLTLETTPAKVLDVRKQEVERVAAWLEKRDCTVSASLIRRYYELTRP